MPARGIISFAHCSFNRAYVKKAFSMPTREPCFSKNGRLEYLFYIPLLTIFVICQEKNKFFRLDGLICCQFYTTHTENQYIACGYYHTKLFWML
jgi:hypothetical protein